MTDDPQAPEPTAPVTDPSAPKTGGDPAPDMTGLLSGIEPDAMLVMIRESNRPGQSTTPEHQE
jgi:hypothetical protein